MKQVASPGALKQLKLVASGFARSFEASEAIVASELRSFVLRPLKMKQVASPRALKQVKLVASELRSFGASRFAPSK